MSADLFIRWAEDSLDDVSWISAELFDKKNANTDMLALCLAIAVKYSCPRRDTYNPSGTGPRTATKDEKLRVVMASTVLVEFGAEGASGLDQALIESTVQNYANGGLKKLVDLLGDSDDKVGALVNTLEGLLAQN